MKFGFMEVENFLTIKEARIDLKDRGLLLVQGENQGDTSSDSNGAGKSTLGDAFSWVLYGITARGAKGDGVINNAVGKNTRVSVEIFDGVEQWKISRHRKYKPFKNMVRVEHLQSDGTWKDETLGTDALTQTLIDKIMGCSYDIFVAAVYAAQEKVPDLPSMTDKQLKILVEEAAGVTVLEAAYSEARKALNAAKETLQQNSTVLLSVTNRITDLKDVINSLMADEEAWSEKRQERLDIHRSAHANIVAKAKEAIAAAQKDDIPAQRKKIEEIDAEIASVETERQEERRLAKELSDARSATARAEATAEALKREYALAKRAVDEVEQRVGEACGECGKEYCEHDLSDARDIAKKTAADKLAKARTAKSALEDAQKLEKQRSDALEAFRSTMTSVSKASALRSDYSDVLNDMLARERNASNLKDNVAASKLAFRQISDEDNPCTKRIESERQRLKKLESERDEYQQKVEESQKEVTICEETANVFSPAGVRAYILDDVTPFLNAQTAKYLGALSDGNITATWSTLTRTAKGDLKEKFAIDVVNAQGGDSFALISGGEKRKVRIAAVLALQDLVARRASKPISMFVGDEIDDALDPAGQERLMGILEEKARERGSVILISHADLKDWASQQIIVRKTGRGESTIAEVTA